MFLEEISFIFFFFIIEAPIYKLAHGPNNFTEIPRFQRGLELLAENILHCCNIREVRLKGLDKAGDSLKPLFLLLEKEAY